MKSNSEVISELTSKWCSLICADHHKDKDMHFYIEVDYSYGKPPVYHAQHNGYVADSFFEAFTCFEDAEEFLVRKLRTMVEEGERWQLANQ